MLKFVAISLAFASSALAAPTPEECEASLRAALCVTSATKVDIAFAWQKVSCETDSDRYLPAAMELYREIPAPIQPLYCSLKRIFLSDSFSSVAFASVTMKEGQINGAFVGIRKASFAEPLTASSLLSWKEQLNFGGSKEYLSRDPRLVELRYGFQLENPRMDALLYVLLHELGHVVDFRNSLTRAGGRWFNLSWATEKMPLPQAYFEGQEKICYYYCKETFPSAAAAGIYASLKRSAFITTYSGLSVREDFAEFWAWYLLREYKGADYRIFLPGEGEIEMNSVFTQNPKVRAKMELMREIFRSPETKLAF